jgi:hypothetical protein
MKPMFTLRDNGVVKPKNKLRTTNNQTKEQQMTTLDKLKKKYAGKNLKTMEILADKKATSSLNARKEFIMILFFLERTNMFRKGQFKKSSFKEYLAARFNMAKTKYDKERKAFITHPGMVEKIGLGNVIKIDSKCDAIGTTKAITEIKGKPDSVKQSTIDNIIKKHMPKPVVKADVTPRISDLTRTVASQKETITETTSTAKSLSEQLDRAKKTIAKLKAENIKLRDQLATFQSAKVSVMNIMDGFANTEAVGV